MQKCGIKYRASSLDFPNLTIFCVVSKQSGQIYYTSTCYHICRNWIDDLNPLGRPRFAIVRFRPE